MRARCGFVFVGAHVAEGLTAVVRAGNRAGKRGVGHAGRGMWMLNECHGASVWGFRTRKVVPPHGELCS